MFEKKSCVFYRHTGGHFRASALDDVGQGYGNRRERSYDRLQLVVELGARCVWVCGRVYCGYVWHACRHRDRDTHSHTHIHIHTHTGNVEYVFSDKTGTLTKNVMHFKHCSIGGHVFLDPMSV